MPFIRASLAENTNIRIYPKGTSMMPMIRQGIDSVLLSPVTDKLKKYNLPLYQRKNGQYVLHRIVAVGDTYTCIGDNQFDYERGLQQEQMIAVVTAIFRGDRRYSVNSLGYQIYCRVWHYSRQLRYCWRRGACWLRRLLK